MEREEEGRNHTVRQTDFCTVKRRLKGDESRRPKTISSYVRHGTEGKEEKAERTARTAIYHVAQVVQHPLPDWSPRRTWDVCQCRLPCCCGSILETLELLFSKTYGVVCVPTCHVHTWAIAHSAANDDLQ